MEENAIEENKVMSPGIKGLLIALVLIIYSAVIMIMNQVQNQSLSFVSLALFMGAIIWACIHFANQMDGNVTFGKVFNHGFKASAAVAVLSALWLFLAFTFIFPSAMDQIIDAQRIAMEKKGVSDDDIEKTMGAFSKARMPLMVVSSVFMNLVIGAIASLIGAAIAKKNPNTTMPQ